MEEKHTLAELIDDLRRRPVSAAMADKKGKFPMAAMKLSAEGNYDMVPLTHALTAENFGRLQALIAALGKQQALIASAPEMLEALRYYADQDLKDGGDIARQAIAKATAQ